MKKRMMAWLFAAALVMCSVTAMAAVKTMPDGGKFDAAFYAAAYPDVRAAFGNNEALLYQHFRTNGQAEGRRPYAAVKVMPDGGLFDAAFYAATYPDVKAAFGTSEALLYQHYVTNGKAEGRLPYAASGTPAKQAAATAAKAYPGLDPAFTPIIDTYMAAFAEKSIRDLYSTEGYQAYKSRYSLVPLERYQVFLTGRNEIDGSPLSVNFYYVQTDLDGNANTKEMLIGCDCYGTVSVIDIYQANSGTAAKIIDETYEVYPGAGYVGGGSLDVDTNNRIHFSGSTGLEDYYLTFRLVNGQLSLISRINSGFTSRNFNWIRFAGR